MSQASVIHESQGESESQAVNWLDSEHTGSKRTLDQADIASEVYEDAHRQKKLKSEAVIAPDPRHFEPLTEENVSRLQQHAWTSAEEAAVPTKNDLDEMIQYMR